MKVVRSLAVEGDRQALVRHLARDYRSWESILLVGHEPYLSHLAGVLTGAPALSMDFQKGGMCLLSSDSLTYGPCATLEWLLTPKILKKLS